MGVLNAIVIPYLKNKGNGKKSGKPNSQKSIKQRSMFQRFIFRCYGRLCDPYNESDDFGEEERPLPSKRKESTAFQAPSISSEIAKVSSEYLDWMFYWCCIPIRPPAQTPPVVDRAEAPELVFLEDGPDVEGEGGRIGESVGENRIETGGRADSPAPRNVSAADEVKLTPRPEGTMLPYSI